MDNYGEDDEGFPGHLDGRRHADSPVVERRNHGESPLLGNGTIPIAPRFHSQDMILGYHIQLETDWDHSSRYRGESAYYCTVDD